MYAKRWILNSFIISLSTVIGNVIFASMAGYAFAKIPFKGGKWLFGMILVAMMIPYQVTQVPLYILVVKQFKMSNTYAALILPGIVSSYNVFLAKPFFTSIRRKTPAARRNSAESRAGRKLKKSSIFAGTRPIFL